MHVLLIAPADRHSDLYIKEAFEELGHSVSTYDYRTVAATSGMDTLIRELPAMSADHDFTLILKGEIIPPPTIRSMKNAALFNFDCHYPNAEWFLKSAAAAKWFFTICRGLLNMLAEHQVNGFYLLEGASPKYHHPELPDENQESFYRSDIAFIGTIQGIEGRASWLTQIAKRFPDQLKLWGSFPVTIPNTRHMGRPPDEDSGHNKVVSSSKIILDYCRRPDIEGGFSARIFRTMAAGGFTLMRYVPGIEGILKPGEHLDVFNTDAECLAKIEYYLAPEHKNERERIAADGCKEVLVNHTFVKRVQEMLTIIGVH